MWSRMINLLYLQPNTSLQEGALLQIFLPVSWLYNVSLKLDDNHCYFFFAHLKYYLLSGDFNRASMVTKYLPIFWDQCVFLLHYFGLFSSILFCYIKATSILFFNKVKEFFLNQLLQDLLIFQCNVMLFMQKYSRHSWPIIHDLNIILLNVIVLFLLYCFYCMFFLWLYIFFSPGLTWKIDLISIGLLGKIKVQLKQNY